MSIQEYCQFPVIIQPDTSTINITGLLYDNIFAMFGGCGFQQIVGIYTGTNYAHLLVDLFLYPYEEDFM